MRSTVGSTASMSPTFVQEAGSPSANASKAMPLFAALDREALLLAGERPREVAQVEGDGTIDAPVVGDFNADGNSDLAIANADTGNVGVLLGNGAGGFAAAVVGKGFIRGRPVVFCVTDFAFMAGSMGSVVGEKLAHGTEEATRLQLPLVIVSGSGGGAYRSNYDFFPLLTEARAQVGDCWNDVHGGPANP